MSNGLGIVSDNEDFKRILREYSKENKDIKEPTPQFIIESSKDTNFMSTYAQEAKDRLDISNFKLMDFYQYRVVTLFKYLIEAERAIELQAKRGNVVQDRLKGEYLSQLQAVNDIVVTNKDLIYSNYILKWLFDLNEIYLGNKNMKNCENGFFSFFNGKTDSKGFYVPDMLHGHTLKEGVFGTSNQTSAPDPLNISKETDEYNKKLEEVLRLIMIGSVEEAQDRSLKSGMFNINHILGSGLPQHDFQLDEKLDIEFDLLPLFCKTTEIRDLREGKLSKNVIGNSKWTQKMQSEFQFANKDSATNNLKQIRSLISGSYPSNLKGYTNIEQLCDLMYLINSFSVSTITTNYSKLNICDLNYISSNKSGSSAVLKEKPFMENLFSVINYIKSKENTKKLKDHVFIIELTIIQLFLLNSRISSSDQTNMKQYIEYYTNLCDLLKNTHNSPEFASELENMYQILFSKLGNSQIQNKQLKELQINYIRYYYDKVFSLSLIILYYTSTKVLDLYFNVTAKKRESKESIYITDSLTKQLFENHDAVLLNTIDSIIEIKRASEQDGRSNNSKDFKVDSSQVLYLLGYCLNYYTIERKTIWIGDQIDPKDVENFSREIEKVFPTLQTKIRLKLAEERRFSYSTKDQLITLDESLLRTYINVAEEDKNNLNKIKHILNNQFQSNVERNTILFKICLKYLFLNKNIEVEQCLSEFNIKEMLVNAVSKYCIESDIIVSKNSTNDQNIDRLVVYFIQKVLNPLDVETNLHLGFLLIYYLQKAYKSFRDIRESMSNNERNNQQFISENQYQNAFITSKNCFQLINRVVNKLESNHSSSCFDRSFINIEQEKEFLTACGDWAIHLIKWIGQLNKLVKTEEW